MDIEFDEKQKMLKAGVRNFMEKEIIPLADEYDKVYNPFPKELHTKLFNQLIPLGFVSGLVPEEAGGAGIDFLSYGIILEELARACASLAVSEVVHHVVGPLALYQIGSEEQKEKYLQPAMSGEMLCAVGMTEPDVGSGFRDIKTTAVLSGENYVINGAKTWITNGTFCDLILLTVRTDEGKSAEAISLVLVERAVSEFESRELPKMGLRSCPTGELVFQDCLVPRENLFGLPGEGYRKALEAIMPIRLGVGATGVGVAQAAIDASIKYAQERKQFNRPIGKFQLVQEMIADMVIETESARLLVYKAWDLLKKGANCLKEASMVKAYAPEVAIRVTSKGIEIHGAYGISQEYSLERYFRDARSLTAPDGTTGIHKLIVGREVLGMAAFV